MGLLALGVIAMAAGAAGATVASTGSGSPGGGSAKSARTSSLRSSSRVPAPHAGGAARQAGVNVYLYTRAGMLAAVARRALYLVYAPDSQGNGVYVIDPKTYRVIRYIQTGAVVQHVVPSWDLQTLYATNDVGNSLTPIDPNTGRRAGPNIPVTDPYNMYFTPRGRHAIVVEEMNATLAFRNPHTFALQRPVRVRCAGVDHMDFSADGSFALASCASRARWCASTCGPRLPPRTSPSGEAPKTSSCLLTAASSMSRIVTWVACS